MSDVESPCFFRLHVLRRHLCTAHGDGGSVDCIPHLTRHVLIGPASSDGNDVQASISELDLQGYTVGSVAGIPYTPFIKEGIVKELRLRHNLRGATSPDIVVATFPKCGTTWMQQIVLLLLAGGDATKVRDPMKMSPWIEMACSTMENGVDFCMEWSPPTTEQVLQPTRRVLKTHAPVQLVPWVGGTAPGTGIPRGAKVIVVTRNPKDAVVSHFHHTKDTKIFKYKGNWEHFLTKLWLAGHAEFGCFWAWHDGWWRAHMAAPEQIAWVSYEELQADLPRGIAKIAQICGIPATDELIGAVVRASSFGAMKEQFAAEDAKKRAQGQFVKENHIRQGTVGSWRNVFTEQQNASFDAHHARRCNELGLPAELFSFA